eukprot:295790-Pelagomonas_calceolata.AAC.3
MRLLEVETRVPLCQHKQELRAQQQVTIIKWEVGTLVPAHTGAARTAAGHNHQMGGGCPCAKA